MKFLILQIIKIPEDELENEIPDSICIVYQKLCTIPALKLMQTKHIDKQAIKSLKFVNEVPLNKVTTTVKI
jgi:hypothetical protein